jgi:Tol biopolymer transport system component
MDRWASSPDYSPGGERIALRCHYPTLSQALEDMFRDLGQGSLLFQWGYIPQATEICTVRTDGRHLVRLTHNQAIDRLPAWSPDGQFIAYISDPPYTLGSTTEQAIHVMRDDGSRLMRFSENLNVRWERLAWSPDGKKLSFAAEDPLEHELGINLYEAVVESEDIHELTALPGDELGTRWSPDGGQLAFIWFPNGYGGPCLTCSKDAAIRITDAEGSSYLVVDNFANIGGLTWSPDGARLAFWGSLTAGCLDDDCIEVYVLDLLNDSIECLTEQYDLVVTGETVWSPDGERIAFTARASGEAAIYTITPDGKSLSRLTAPGAAAGRNLVWAPDGQSIAFAYGWEGEKSHIWFVEIEGGTLRKL